MLGEGDGDGADGGQLVWSKGVVLAYQGARAELTDRQDRGGANGLSIRISGEPQTRLVLLALVRREIELTHRRSFPNLDYELLVPCVCPHCRAADQPKMYEYGELERSAANDRLTVYCSLGDADVPIRDLLGNLVSRGYEGPSRLGHETGMAIPPWSTLRKADRMSRRGIGPADDKLIGLLTDIARRPVTIQLVQNQTVDVQQQTRIDLNIQIVQAGYRELGDSLALLKEDAEDAGLKKKAAASLEKELDRVSAAVAKLEACDSAEAAKQEGGALSRLKGFVEKLDDGNKLVGRTIKGLEDGRQHAAKILGLYNKLAPWCGLPSVPNPFAKLQS